MSWKDQNPMESDLINIHSIEITKGVWFREPSGNFSGRRPIGYPIVLALFYKLFGIHIEIIWVVHFILYLLTAYLLFLIGREVFSETAGLLAAFFYSIYPISIYSVKLITDEHALLPVWYLSLFLLIREIQGKTLKLSWLWYGLLFGFGAMIRTHIIFMPFIAGLIFLLKRYPIKKILLNIFLIILTMQAINLPWIIRNYHAWGVPVLYTATGAFVYAQVNFTAGPEGGGHIPKRGEPGFSEELESAIASGNEGLIHKISNREMRRWIFKNPGHFLSMSIGRILSFMCWNRKGGVWPLWFQFYEGHYDKSRAFTQVHIKLFEEFAFVSYYIFFNCSLFSVVLILKKWKPFTSQKKVAIFLFGSVFFFWFLEHMIIYPDRKYRYPLEPLMILISCFFFEYVLKQYQWSKLFNYVGSFGKKRLAH